MTKDIDVVAKGGGAKIPALVGAVAGLKAAGFEIARMAGTSAGSIVSALEAAGFSPAEMDNLTSETDFKWVAGDYNIPLLLNWIARKKWGLVKGDRFEKWFSDILESKGVDTFSDTKIPLRVIATDLTNGRAATFSTENSPNMSIARAVRMSISIPGVFVPVICNGNVMVDGGILRNYPIKEFNDNKRTTIGLKLVSSEEGKPCKITNTKEFISSIANTAMDAIEREHIADADWAVTIPINTGTVSATDFGISPAIKVWLYNQGANAVKCWVKKMKQ